MMRLIPEYAPVKKLMLCFVHDFFNTRFHYGAAQAAIIAAARQFAEVEVLADPAEMSQLYAAMDPALLESAGVRIEPDSPGRAILAESLPIFAEETGSAGGQKFALLFPHARLDEVQQLDAFNHRLCTRLGMVPLEMGFDFSTAHLLVNEELVLLSAASFRGAEGQRRLAWFQAHFPQQSFHIVPPLAGDVTFDLDMFLWPIAPRTWIVSEYAPGTPEADSVAPSLAVLAAHGHTALRVPGLPHLQYDDINTMPNYANGIILNRGALAPCYGRSEDRIVQDLLREYGFTVCPIDCQEIILTQCGVHCITKSVPE